MFLLGSLARAGIFFASIFSFLFIILGSDNIVVSGIFSFLVSAFLFFVPIFDHRLKFVRVISFLALLVSVCVVTSIFLSVIFQSAHFFEIYPFAKFFFGTNWAPDRPADCANNNCFGVLSLISGTMLITLVATCASVPVSLLSAIYLSEYSSKKIRKFSSSVIDVFAGVPTIVYGYFALNFIYPAMVSFANALSIHMDSNSALVAGLTVGFMLLPSTTSIMLECLRGVPKIMRYGSFAIGATGFETVFRVILPTSLPMLICAILLSVSRAIGETMIVLMTAGVTSNFTFNPLESITTITIQIVVLLTGEADYASIKVLAAYALTVFLFIFTFVLNFLAHLVIKKYNKKLAYN